MRSSSQRPAPNDTIYLLEILRFIACIGVILYHYQHFITYRGSQYIPSEIPFEKCFGWFYRNGGSGVQVFWCLSGIIFAHVYQTRVANREISIPQFFWRRFSRLYPLHFLTLLIVAGLVFVLRGVTDLTHFIYEFNDMKHFLLNVVFTNYWGFQSGTSFNGPVWSVSIELIAYLVFMIIAISIQITSKKASLTDYLSYFLEYRLLVGTKTDHRARKFYSYLHRIIHGWSDCLHSLDIDT